MALEPKYIHPGHGKPLPLSAYAKVQAQLTSRSRSLPIVSAAQSDRNNIRIA